MARKWLRNIFALLTNWRESAPDFDQHYRTVHLYRAQLTTKLTTHYVSAIKVSFSLKQIYIYTHIYLKKTNFLKK